jgi:hypothetical protein
MKRDGRRLGRGKPGLSLLLSRATFGKGTTIHNEQQVGNTAVELSTRSKAFNAERTWEPRERALKAEEKSTSAKARLTVEDVASARTSSKEAHEERTQEWWEGYDPGMDASF